MDSAGPSSRDLRHATNESVHRTVNERRWDALSTPDVAMACECECHRAECGNNFNVTMIDYEAVRAHARRFLLAPDHQAPEESIISTSSAYWVIEKLGEQGVIADALDPRKTHTSIET
jgi:hypothetical protein